MSENIYNSFAIFLMIIYKQWNQTEFIVGKRNEIEENEVDCQLSWDFFIVLKISIYVIIFKDCEIHKVYYNEWKTQQKI